jgi:hypothetical protein
MVGCAGDSEPSRSSAPSSSVTTTIPPVSVGTIVATIAPEAARLGDETGIEVPTKVREILEHVDELLGFDTDVIGFRRTQRGRSRHR